MIARVLFIAACVLAPHVSHSFEASLAAGLAVSVERIAEPVAVDGVAMTVQRAIGADVPELARRIEAQWHSQGSAVRVLQQGEWTLRIRMQGTKSEVVQWRTVADMHELLWSSLDAAGAVESPPAAGFALPAGCSWGRSVSGRSGQQRYLQRSGRCALSMQELSKQLQRALPAQGWHVRTAADEGLLLERAGAEGLLSIAKGPDGASTWLVWLQVGSER